MTLREAIERGVVSLDDNVDWGWWHNNEPTIEEPEEYAREAVMAVGETFECTEFLAIHPPRVYRVVSAPDPETGDGEYKVERVDAE